MGFIEGNVDPCIYVKKSAMGVVYILLYIDDNLMVGDMVALDHAISALKSNRLVPNIMEEPQDYLSC